jgi:hypothetical protein
VSSKPETTFTRGVLQHIPKDVYHMKNNNPYLGGVPDLWFSGRSGDLWVEMKYLPTTPQSGSVVPTNLLSALQAQWLQKRYEEGRQTAVIIGCPDGGVFLPGNTWKDQIPAVDFVDRVQSRPALAQSIVERVNNNTR